MRACVIVSCLALSPFVTIAQDEGLAFEVASVRENVSVGRGGSIAGPNPGQWRVDNIALRNILTFAFELRDYQLIGSPEWTRTTKYDIVAKYPDGAEPAKQYRAMIRNLLRNRFALKEHRETRDVPVYRLLTARSDRRLGPQLFPSDVDCAKWFAEGRPQLNAGRKSVVPGAQTLACAMNSQRNYITARTRTMADLARSLETRAGRPVKDETGLSGTFDFDLLWSLTPDFDTGQGHAVDVDNGASIFTALEEQLGLKLESAKGAVEVVVIDSIGRPTPD